MQELNGYVDRITYYDEESHFMVATLIPPTGKEIIITGTLPALQVGETVHCKGGWQRHPKHGLQFHVQNFSFELPTNVIAIEKFLGSGAVRGIGPGFAKKIIDAFGPRSLEIIDKFPDKLLEVPRLGEKRRDMLVSAFQEHKAVHEVFIFLSSYGISRSLAKKILRTWGNFAIREIKKNPYRLAKEVRGIGFTTADAIARHVGFTQDAPERITAGIDYTLYELAEEGHVCYPVDAFVEIAATRLSVSPENVRISIGHLFQKGDIELRTVENTLTIWSKPLFASEQGIASEVQRLMHSDASVRKPLADKALLWAEEQGNIRFADLQKEALRNAFQEKVSIITGGPGTGKSTITKALLAVYSKLTSKIVLAAPTGRAAKRMSEITGKYAMTLHRLLKFNFESKGFVHNRKNPITADLVILDEVSMIDTYLMYHFLQALPSECRLIFIGDVDQLPSIGPGSVLRDLIDSQAIPTTRLSVIFRQKRGSHIISNAHKINEGQMPYLENEEPSDFLFEEALEPEQVLSKIVDLTTNVIPKRYGYDPKRDIQVLVPMRKGACGIEACNTELQKILTPAVTVGPFRVGDKVIQLSNNYTKEVYNGDIGYVQSTDKETQQLVILFDERPVSYYFSETDELALAYAVSIHKYQGSEAPVIVMPVHTTHFKMLTKNLIYTGVTRGRKLVVLVGTKKAIAIAVHTENSQKRYTALKQAFGA